MLGLEVRTHSVKAAPVDTSTGDFQRPGVVVPVPEPSREAVHGLNKLCAPAGSQSSDARRRNEIRVTGAPHAEYEEQTNASPTSSKGLCP